MPSSEYFPVECNGFSGNIIVRSRDIQFSRFLPSQGCAPHLPPAPLPSHLGEKFEEFGSAADESEPRKRQGSPHGGHDQGAETGSVGAGGSARANKNSFTSEVGTVGSADTLSRVDPSVEPDGVGASDTTAAPVPAGGAERPTQGEVNPVSSGEGGTDFTGNPRSGAVGTTTGRGRGGDADAGSASVGGAGRGSGEGLRAAEGQSEAGAGASGDEPGDIKRWRGRRVWYEKEGGFRPSPAKSENFPTLRYDGLHRSDESHCFSSFSAAFWDIFGIEARDLSVKHVSCHSKMRLPPHLIVAAPLRTFERSASTCCCSGLCGWVDICHLAGSSPVSTVCMH